MTTHIFTFAEKDPVNGDNQYRVFFQIKTPGSSSTTRAIDVEINTFQEAPHKLAELLALKYILLHTTYAGFNRTGRDLALHVSNGAIRKVQKKQTTNGDMVVHGRFLQVRFSDATIKTERKFSWVADFNGKVEDIDEKDCIDPPVKTHVGDLHLTRHAVERFSERMHIPTMDKSWRRLSKLLTQSKWSMKKPTKSLRDGKPHRTTETWQLQKGEGPTIDVVIVRNPQISRIVTVIA